MPKDWKRAASESDQSDHSDVAAALDASKTESFQFKPLHHTQQAYKRDALAIAEKAELFYSQNSGGGLYEIHAILAAWAGECSGRGETFVDSVLTCRRMAATLKSALQKDLALTGTKFYAWLVQGCPDIQIGTPFNPFAEEPVAADHDRAQPNRVLLVEVPQMMHMATMSTPYHGAYTSPQYTKCPVTGKSAVHAVQATLAVIFHAQASGRAPDIRTLTPSTIATVLYKDFSLCRRQVAQELVRYFATDLARELSKVFGDESALISSLRAEAERSTYLDNAYHRIDKYAPQAVHQWGQLQEKNFMIHRRRLTQALGVSNRTKKHLRSSSDDQSAADAPKVAATNRNTIPLRTSGRSARNPNPIPQSGLQSAPQPGPQSGVPLPQSGAPPPQSGAPAVVLAARVPVVHRDPNIDPALYLITSPSAFEQRLATQPDVVNSAEMQEMIMNMPEAGNEEQASESDQSSARRQRTRL